MKFAHPMWLFGAAFALVIAALLVWGGFVLLRSVEKFGDKQRIESLVTFRAARRRAAKGVLLVLATALVFVAAARPQYGRGTKLIPATNLDVVLVLDYSKSMYARDVVPSRIARAKIEVANFVKALPGARFAAVAFAGEPIGFPLTADGMAIAQFFRQLTPNDMPVGGTAIGRALAKAAQLLARDPKSRKHKRVIVLITDGEDLEGNPVSVASSIGQQGTTIHVVQIGGRSPEPIPDVDSNGQVHGYRTGKDGKPLMTSLSTEGEKQLVEIAKAGHGVVIRAVKGSTGIEQITRKMRQMMQTELSERVETLYADVYAYPLGAALVLLLIETFLSAAPRRRERRPNRPSGRQEESRTERLRLRSRRRRPDAEAIHA